MKFTQTLKHIPVGGEVGRIENSGRLYPCFVCRTVTGWRNNGDGSCPGVPCCSDECLDVMDEGMKEIASSAVESNRISSTEPVLASPKVSQTHERESDDEEEAAGQEDSHR